MNEPNTRTVRGRLWKAVRRNPWTVALILTVLTASLVLLIWGKPETGELLESGPDSEGWPWIRVAIIFGLVLAGSSFLYYFTGRPDDKIRGMMVFSYLFTIFALLVSIIPFTFSYNEKLVKEMENFPIGIFVGCSTTVNDQQKPILGEIACKNNNSQWVINIGGIPSPQSKQDLPGDSGDGEPTKTPTTPAGSSGSNPDDPQKRGWRIVKIQGGLVVPLYFVVLSLMGAAVGMTRRVPEYQRRYLKEDENPPDAKIYEKRPRKWITANMLRESLVFQIMQVVSAPLIAIAAYYLIKPDQVGATVAIGFAAGFASEPILMAIRNMAETFGSKTSEGG